MDIFEKLYKLENNQKLFDRLWDDSDLVLQRQMIITPSRTETH